MISVGKKAAEEARQLAYGAGIALQSMDWLDRPESRLKCLVEAKSKLRQALAKLGG